MNPGELRSRIVIEKRTLTPDTYVTNYVWSTYATIWAKKIHLSGRELEQARQVSPNVKVEFVMRYRSDLENIMRTENYRISYRYKKYNIRDVKDLNNMHEWLYVKCEVNESEYGQQ